MGLVLILIALASLVYLINTPANDPSTKWAVWVILITGYLGMVNL
jgi:hypothetical protein